MQANGYHIVPPGKLANAVTWLEMYAPFPQRALTARPDLGVERLTSADAARYMAVYRVLAHSWLWEGRLRLSPDDLGRMLDNADMPMYALKCQGRDCGLLELDFSTSGEAELAYFGIFEDCIGQGTGAWLLQVGMAEVARRKIPRFFVHTCNFDHPSALGFYRAQGFVPYQCGYEIMDDPRLTGILPPQAAPHVPLLSLPKA